MSEGDTERRGPNVAWLPPAVGLLAMIVVWPVLRSPWPLAELLGREPLTWAVLAALPVGAILASHASQRFATGGRFAGPTALLGGAAPWIAGRAVQRAVLDGDILPAAGVGREAVALLSRGGAEVAEIHVLGALLSAPMLAAIAVAAMRAAPAAPGEGGSARAHVTAGIAAVMAVVFAMGAYAAHTVYAPLADGEPIAERLVPVALEVARVDWVVAVVGWVVLLLPAPLVVRAYGRSEGARVGIVVSAVLGVLLVGADTFLGAALRLDLARVLPNAELAEGFQPLTLGGPPPVDSVALWVGADGATDCGRREVGAAGEARVEAIVECIRRDAIIRRLRPEASGPAPGEPRRAPREARATLGVDRRVDAGALRDTLTALLGRGFEELVLVGVPEGWDAEEEGRLDTMFPFYSDLTVQRTTGRAWLGEGETPYHAHVERRGPALARGPEGATVDLLAQPTPRIEGDGGVRLTFDDEVPLARLARVLDRAGEAADGVWLDPGPAPAAPEPPGPADAVVDAGEGDGGVERPDAE